MKIKLTEAVTADQIRQSMSGFVGPKFAKKASDEDIMKMVDLKDKIAKLQNTHISPIQKQIDALYKQYKIKSNKGIEESTSMNEISFEDIKTFYVTVKVILDWGLPLLTLATIIAGVGVIKAIDLVKQGKDAFMKKYNQLKNAVDTNKVKKIEVKLKSFKDKKVESTSINEVQYKDALAQFNSELKKLSPIKRMATHFNKTIDEVLRAIQPYISVSKFENGDVKQIKIHFTESNSNIMIKHIKNFTKQESVNEELTRSDLSFMDRAIREWDAAIHDMNFHIRLYSDPDYSDWAKQDHLDKIKKANTKRIEIQDNLINQVNKIAKIKLDK